MKRSLSIAILVFLSIQSWGQESPVFDRLRSSQIDSIRKVLKEANNDTIRMTIYRQLILFYQDIYSDSSLHYAGLQYEVAGRVHQKFWEADALDNSGLSHKNRGAHAKALESYLNAIDILKDITDNDPIVALTVFTHDGSTETARLGLEATIYVDLGNLYRETKNFTKAIHYGKESVRVATSINNRIILLTSYQVLGESYMTNGQLDSALLCLTKSMELSNSTGFVNENGQTLRDLGIVFQSKSQPALARKYFKEGIKASEAVENSLDAGENSISLARLYLSSNNIDSSLIYAYKGLFIFKQANRALGVLGAYRLIANLYQLRSKPDSTLHYMQLFMALNETVYNEEKIRQFQNIGFEQQLKVADLEKERLQTMNSVRTYSLISGLAVVLLVVVLLYRNNREKQKANKVLEDTLTNLKSTQAQLIQSEKMASLGELTAGIAHEIQNPLNFVNNFSEVSNELIGELKAELATGNKEVATEIANDISQNLEKINHHGKRADAIVKGMLQHSRTSSGQNELTDINALCDEYLRLSYHGLRAKDKSFNAKFETDFDSTLPKINVIPQDIGRVILNLINNAFYAVSERANNQQRTTNNQPFNPTVTVSTKNIRDKIEISVKDNGTGIPQKVVDKIFQPFFTTKPTGQGTGLGLSLSYDIVTKGHGGELKVETKEGERTEFIIVLQKPA